MTVASDKIKDNHKRRDYIIIGLVACVIIFAGVMKWDDDIKKAKDREQNQKNQKIIVTNQKALASGFNAIGNIIVEDIANEIPEIKNKTDLIDDIKNDTTKIVNITIAKNGSLMEGGGHLQGKVERGNLTVAHIE